MNAVTRKLKSKSGISMAIALVFFLLCAMVGTVVLSAASTGASSTARERQLYRETEALISAAKLLSGDIQEMTFTGNYTSTKTVTTKITTTTDETGAEQTEKTVTESDPTVERGTCDLTGSKFFIGKLVIDDIYFNNQGISPAGAALLSLPEPLSISFGAVTDKHIPQVTGSINVKNDYTITVVLQCGKNTLQMSFPPAVTSEMKDGTPTITSADQNSSTKTTVTTYATTITWGQPTMWEGGATNEETTQSQG